MVSVEFAQSEKYSLSTDIFFFFKNCTCPQVKQAQQSEQGVQFSLYVQSISKKERNVCRHLWEKSPYFMSTPCYYHLIITLSFTTPVTLNQ